MKYDENAIEYKKVQKNWQWIFIVLFIAPSLLAAFAFFLPILENTNKDHILVPVFEINKLEKPWYIVAFAVGVLSSVAIAIDKFLKADNDLTESQKIWVKSRSTAEAIKSHIYLFAAHSGIYSIQDPGATLLLHDEIQKIVLNASEILLPGINISGSTYIGKEPKDGISAVDYIDQRLKEQLDWYENKIIKLEDDKRVSKCWVRCIGILTSILGVLTVYFNSAFILPFLAAIATSVKKYSDSNKYSETISKYNAAYTQLNNIILIQNQIAAAELISQSEQVMRAENGSWRNMW